VAKCKATRRDGTPCQAEATASGWCFSHDPALKDKRDQARKKGGRERMRGPVALPPDTPDLPMTNLAEVRDAMAATWNMVRTGRLDCKVGNALAVIANVVVRCVVDGEMEQRLAAVEAQLKGRS
jgi:hypothetical protein